jgi:hypothetical protein
MGDDPNKPKEVRFVYEKARHHRTLHADGAWSALTPQLEIQTAFFANLRPLPISETRTIQEDDTLPPGTHQEKEGMVREVDVTVVVNLKVAKSIIGLLQQMVDSAEVIIAERKAAQAVQESSNTEKV